MRRFFILAFLMSLMTMGSMAQSAMTDEQVLQYVVEEHQSGTSQAQIVTKLMQRGVDIEQESGIGSDCYQREIG